MATSRTGTAEWKKTVQLALHQAKAQGQRHCSYCQISLNYTDRRAFNGAQVDHIVPHSKGGTNEQTNLVICCRTCNISKGNRTAPKIKTTLARKPLKTSRKW